MLKLGFSGTNSFLVAKSIDEVIKKFKPDVVLLTVGINDIFTASEYVEASSETVGHLDFWDPLTMLRRYSRLYKLLYMTKQGTTTADNALVGTNDEAMVPGDTPVQNRALLKWSDRLEERVQKMLAFKEANVDVSKGLDWPPGANTSKDLETPKQDSVDSK